MQRSPLSHVNPGAAAAPPAATASRQVITLGGVLLAAVGAILFSSKSIFIKLAYAVPGLDGTAPVDAVTLLTLRMLFSMPFFVIIGIWAKDFQQLQLIPLLILTPLIFLGGTFYSIDMLPGIWRTLALFNPVVYLVSGFRWSFFGTADVPVVFSLLAIAVFTGACLVFVWWIFKTGWRIRQ